MEYEFCRVCLNGTVTLVDIFAKRQQIDPDNPEPCLADMLNELAECHININDELTHKICLSCVINAQNAWRFKRTCEKSYKRLTATGLQPQKVHQQQELDPLDSQEDNLFEESETLFVKLEQIDEMEEETEITLKPYKCNMCSKAFDHMKILRVHQKRHAEQKFKTLKSLPKAKKLIQKSNKQKQLGKIKSQLKDTMLKDDRKLHQCSYCTKAFQSKQGLKRHNLIHTGECPYQCPYCSNDFYRSDYCKAHIWKMHKGFEIPSSLLKAKK